MNQGEKALTEHRRIRTDAKPGWLSSTMAKLRTSRGRCFHLGFRIGLGFWPGLISLDRPCSNYAGNLSHGEPSANPQRKTVAYSYLWGLFTISEWVHHAPETTVTT